MQKPRPGWSLRTRLFGLWVLALLATSGVGVLLVELYAQSMAARLAQAETEVRRACEAIRDRYALSSGVSDAKIVAEALAHAEGVEGGIWQQGIGSRAYAYPTYQGTGPKTDVPEAEMHSIATVNKRALEVQQPVVDRRVAKREILLFAACPIAGRTLSAWTLTRVQRAPALERLRLALGLLLGLLLLMAAWLAWFAIGFTRRVKALEVALSSQDLDTLPSLPPTGEAELDRIVAALNEALARLRTARARAEQLTKQAAMAERMAAVGRVAAGVAHEIRNPLGAMRLKAEGALEANPARQHAALKVVLEQIDRLDRLVGELLAMTQSSQPSPKPVHLARFVEEVLTAHRERAAAQGIHLTGEVTGGSALFDPHMIRRALDNLVLNALQHTPPGGSVKICVERFPQKLRFMVTDTGPGVAESVRQNLFEPFVTSRPDGTGLGLAIAREMVSAHGGTLSLAPSEGKTPAEGATFVIELPESARDGQDLNC
ncbi:MAG: HAMP domain-containing histidine kinase [Acetobacteraceae bacterium]|nr:HAMP domain-containing histidine kinase [Acetobacteraceae bacterium]